VTSLTLYH